MNGRCFEIGVIQAFLDGELEPAVSARVTNHISECETCASVLATAEEETAVVFAALDREMNTLVPTQRLWCKINDSIAFEKEQTPFLQKIWAFVRTQLSSPSLAVAASVLVVVGLFTAFWNLSSDNSVSEVIPNDSSSSSSTPPVTVAGVRYPQATDPVSVDPLVADPQPLQRTQIRNEAIRAAYRPSNVPRSIRRDDVKPEAMTAAYMPGEESYVRTIATMSQTINPQKDSILRPSERIKYERDMAVVNDSIRRLREEVRKNPRNESAKQVLYSSYQNKIDLLNSVSQKEELIASLKQ